MNASRHEQVHEWRVHQRDGPEHEALVEVRERDRRGEQHQEVERAPREQSPEVDEPDQEHGAQREPDPRVVDASPERVVVPAGHRPGDLRPRPGRDDSPRRVVDHGLRDLSVAARVEVHRELLGSRVLVDDRRRGAVARQPVVDLRARARDRDHLRVRMAWERRKPGASEHLARGGIDGERGDGACPVRDVHGDGPRVPRALGDQRRTGVLEPDGPTERRRLHRPDRGGAGDRRLAGGRSQERDRGDRRNREQPRSS